MIMSPCKDCKKRHIGCHDKCDIYLKYKEEIRAFNKKAKEDRYNECVMYEFEKYGKMQSCRLKKYAWMKEFD